jgi:Reverse transcriptase (RNA-dependent DNA polymerase)
MGYSVDHSNDFFSMLNPNTSRIINSRDVIWLGTSFKIWSNTDPQSEKNDIDDDLGDLILKHIERSQVNNEIQPEIKERAKVKLYRQLKRLESSFNPEASKIIENIEQGREIQLDQVNFALFSASASELEPTSFNDAWNHTDPKNRELWEIAMNKELGEIENKKVLEIINKEDVQDGRRTIKCTWIFKIKRNGVFRARLFACGYSQVPGINFNESFAHVINAVSFRIMLISKLVWGLQASIIDVDTAFLHGTLSEEIYMNILNFESSQIVETKNIIQSTPVRFAGLIWDPLSGPIHYVSRYCG